MSTLRAQPGWPDLLVDYAHDGATAQRLVAQLRACQVSALAFLPPAGALGERRSHALDARGP